MSYSVKFDKSLDELFFRRTLWLRSVLGDKIIGKPLSFNRRYVNKTIKNLQIIASDALTKSYAKREFENSTKIIKSWHIKGHGRNAKRENLEKWYKNYIEYKNCVYVYFKNSECLYAGRTRDGSNRPAAHYKDFWFDKATRIMVYSASKTQIAKLECLAIHYFLPKHNINKASSKKWTKKCPICKLHKKIEKELRQIFRINNPKKFRRRNKK